MRRRVFLTTLSLALGMALSLALGMGVSGPALAGVVGGDHDMTTHLTGSEVNYSDQVCRYCHAAHDTSPSSPLWNRDDPSSAYTMYSSPSIDMTIAGSPGPQTLACLSCHDGSIAVDSFYSHSCPTGDCGVVFMSAINAERIIGPDLSDTHPVSVTYDDTADTGGAGGSSRFHTKASVLAAGLKFFGAGEDQLECPTCHEPHQQPPYPFMRIDNGGSALCLTCHDI